MEARWLSAEERRTWLVVATLMERLSQKVEGQLQREAGLSQFEYMVMAHLSEQADRTTRMSRLAALTVGSLPRLSQVVARLEKRGWVTRSPDPSDGRYTLATLTKAGYEKVVATAPGHVETVRTFLFDPLTAKQTRQLGEIGERVLSAIDPSDPRLTLD